MFKKVLFSVFSLAISGSILFSNQTVTYADFYQVKKDLDIYVMPTLNSTKEIIPAGNTISLYCYVNSESYMGSKIWTFADDNGYGGSQDYGYIPDYFLRIGSSSPLIGYCNF
ncbi:hypothetical protein [Bacillus cereus group sp. BfR-BA-01380]|uniref:hypothetical protein n=1 Tax=Bacillus cereus group sp. BfR-BA-01380 TaxID=2920324 RepID=UPI001F56352E|nr:hypothetical protein [Bacillus cereus group sp. BfR-BA-01380]